MMQEKECTDIWRKYQAGKDHHNKANMYTLTEKCHRFYEGDQWHGLQSGDEELPVLNFIKPICRYKIAMVAYSVQGLKLDNGVLISNADLQNLDIDIKIDISPIDPYSVLSRELSLENALAQQHITFEEYVEALDDNSGVPKDKFQAILDRRAQAQQEAAQAMLAMGVPNGMPSTGMGAQGVATASPVMTAGEGMMQNAMPIV